MAPHPSSRWAPWWVGACFAALALAAWWDQRVAFDDAFISYRYAYNWVAGDGVVFNPGESSQRVEGFSNPLWVGLAAVALSLGVEPLTATRAIGVASFVLTLGLLGRALSLAALPLGARALWLIPAAAVLVVPFGLAGAAGSGLETAFVSLCLLTLGGSLLLPDRSRSAQLLRAAAGVLAVLTRLDAVLGVAACALAAGLARSGGERGVARRVALGAVAPAALALSLLFAARRAYYGAWLPNPYYAKGADEWQLGAGLDYLGTFALSCLPALPLLGLAVHAFVRARRADEPRVVRALGYALLCTLLYAGYIAKVGGDFMQYRFVWQVYPLFAGAGLLGLVMVARQWPRVAAAIGLALALSSLRAPVLESDYAMQSLAEMDAYTEAGREVGEVLRERLPPDTVVATTLAGTIAYYSQLEVVDQWGLNDPDVAGWPSLERFQRGHYKRAPAAHLEARRVELAINHPRLCPCDALCIEDAPMLFVRVDPDRCLQGFLVSPKPRLLALACAEPEHFALHGVRCEGRSPGRSVR